MNRQILKLAVPAIFNNITVPLLGLCDTTIAGHLGSASFLAAMAVGTMMLNVIFWLCGFLRMGTSGLSAQALGARDFEMVRGILRKALLIALYISIFILLVQRPLEKLLFLVIAPEESVAELSSLYFRICLWGAPAQLVIMCVSGWFIGLQNTVVPMIIAVGVNIVNILLSICLVFVFRLGFAGVAVGTLSANWLGAVGAACFTVSRLRKIPQSRTINPSLHNDSRKSKFIIQNSKFFKVNTDLFFRSACIMIVTLAMTSYGASLGETTLAANAVIMQFFLFFSYFMDGFAFAGEALVGKSLGECNYRYLRKSVRSLLIWGLGISITFLLLYLFLSDEITALLTSEEKVRKIVGEMKTWLVIMPVITVTAFIFDGIFIGMARTRILFVTTLIAALVFFAIASGGTALQLLQLSNIVLWTAFGSYLLLRGVLLGIEYVKIQRKVLSL